MNRDTHDPRDLSGLRDLRGTALWREAEALFARARGPGSGQISEAVELEVAPDGRWAVCAGMWVNELVGKPTSRICRIDLGGGDVRVLTFGPHTDRSPKIAPGGGEVAFLSDRHRCGDFQLYRLDVASGAARACARVEGWVEYHQWSPSGERVLLGVAAHGADVAGAQGAISTQAEGQGEPSWIPAVETADESHRWRRVWVYEREADRVRAIGPATLNVWEAVWCGEKALLAIVSPGPGEGLWYTATACLIDIESGATREIYRSEDQLGWPAASPSGRYVSLVEAVCSDRGIVAGNLRLIDTTAGAGAVLVDTRGVDVTHAEWRAERRLLVAGHRAFETVVGVVDAGSREFREIWSSEELSGGGRYVAVSGISSLCFSTIATTILEGATTRAARSCSRIG